MAHSRVGVCNIFLCGHIVLFIHVFPTALTEPLLHVAWFECSYILTELLQSLYYHNILVNEKRVV